MAYLTEAKRKTHNIDKERSDQNQRFQATGIPREMQRRFEDASGFSFDDVRVHYNSAEPERFDANAYTQGNQVHIGPNNERHLEHELGHVVQQKQGRVSATGEIGGTPVNENPALEHEASTAPSAQPAYSGMPAATVGAASSAAPVQMARKRRPLVKKGEEALSKYRNVEVVPRTAKFVNPRARNQFQQVELRALDDDMFTSRHDLKKRYKYMAQEKHPLYTKTAKKNWVKRKVAERRLKQEQYQDAHRVASNTIRNGNLDWLGNGEAPDGAKYHEDRLWMDVYRKHPFYTPRKKQDWVRRKMEAFYRDNPDFGDGLGAGDDESLKSTQASMYDDYEDAASAREELDDAWLQEN